VNAVIAEVMRINPAVPMTIPHRAVSKTILNGYEIPKVWSLNILVAFVTSMGIYCQWL
jgi:cytochrome P450